VESEDGCVVDSFHEQVVAGSEALQEPLPPSKADVVIVLLPSTVDVVASVADGREKKEHAVLRERALWK